MMSKAKRAPLNASHNGFFGHIMSSSWYYSYQSASTIFANQIEVLTSKNFNPDFKRT
jgi:hypothetical protein